MASIGFIGLGNMGGHMAHNLIKAGHQVQVFDLVNSVMQLAGERGAKLAGSIADAASNVDVVISMLPAGKHVSEVFVGSEGVLASVAGNTLLIDCSTIDVATARNVASVALQQGLSMLDAPVSGGVGGAQAGTLTFMVGGDAQGFAAAKPYLDIMGCWWPVPFTRVRSAGSAWALSTCSHPS